MVFLLGTKSVGYFRGKGRVTVHWWAQYMFGDTTTVEITRFESIESAFYPDLTAYYRAYAVTWLTENRSRVPEDKSFWDDALKMLDQQKKERKGSLEESLEAVSGITLASPDSSIYNTGRVVGSDQPTEGDAPGEESDG